MNIVYCIDNKPEHVKMVNESIATVRMYNVNAEFFIIVNSNTPIDAELYAPYYTFNINDKMDCRYLKFFIPSILKRLDKCLFVEYDCICFDSLDDIYNENVNYIKLQKDENGLSTGVALMNLDALRKDKFYRCLTDLTGNTTDVNLIIENYNDKIELFDKLVHWTNAYLLQFNNYEPLRKNVHNIKFVNFSDYDMSEFDKCINVSEDHARLLRIEELKNIVSVDDFKSKKIRTIFLNKKYPHIIEWFKKGYIITDNPKQAELALVYGTDYFSKNNKEFIEQIIDNDIPIITIGDTIINKLDKKQFHIGYCLDNHSYFENTKKSFFDKCLEEVKPISFIEKEYCRKLLKLIRNYKLSQYNSTNKNKFPFGGKVLVIDQEYTDQSVIYSNTDENTFKNMLISACVNNPSSAIYVYTDTIVSNKGTFITDDIISECQKLTQNQNIVRITKRYNPYEIINHFDSVYTCSSDFGLYALFDNKTVYTFGTPFYSGLGLTIDKNDNVSNKANISLEQLLILLFDKFYTFKIPETTRTLNSIGALRMVKAFQEQ